MIPTRRFWALIAVGIGLALLGAVVPGMERVVLPYNLILFVLLFLTGLAVPRAKYLRIERSHDMALSVRQPNKISLTVFNDAGVPIRGRVREGSPEFMQVSQVEFKLAIPARRSHALEYHLTPDTRGEERFRDVTLRLLAPLGLVEVERTLPGTGVIHVYPNVLALREYDLLKQRGKLSMMGIRQTRIRGQGTEFESLREYHHDDYRRIDWKSSARRNKLVVRDYEVERNQNVIVCLDIGRAMLAEVDGVGKLDLCLDACLMLLHAARSEGDQTGLMVFSDRVHQFIPPGKGRQQNGAIMDAVHDLDAVPVEANYDEAFNYLRSRWKRRSLIAVFTDSEDEAHARTLTRALSPVCRHQLVLLVRVSDPRIKELQQLPLESPKDLFLRSAALWYSSERRRAESVLAGSGVKSVDSEPKDLTQALVSTYLLVKETARL